MALQHHPTFESMSAEEVAALLEKYSARFGDDLDADSLQATDDLRECLQFFHLLVFERRFDEATQLLSIIRQAAKAALEKRPHDEDLIEIMVETNNIALAFIAVSGEDFSEYPYFADTLRLCEGKRSKLKMHRWRAHIDMVNHYLQWLAAGGDAERLPTDVREALEEAYASLEVRVSTAIFDLERWDEWQYSIPLKRALARFFLEHSRKNEGMMLMSQLLRELPRHPEFEDTDEAEVRLEYGQLLLTLGERKQAAQEFRHAKEIYEKAGEDFEVLAYQAESLLEEAQQGHAAASA